MGNTQLTIQVATSLPNAPHHLSLPFLLPLVIATLHPFQVPPSQKKNHHLEKQISQFRRNYVDVNLHVNPKNQCQPLDIHRIFSHLHRIPGLHETDHHNICSGTSSVNVPNEFHLANSELWNRSWEGVLGWDHKIMFEKYGVKKLESILDQEVFHASNFIFSSFTAAVISLASISLMPHTTCCVNSGSQFKPENSRWRSFWGSIGKKVH